VPGSSPWAAGSGPVGIHNPPPRPAPVKQTDRVSALWSSLAASAGAVATTLIGVMAGAAVGKRSQDQQWARDQVARACVRLLDESSRVLADLNDMDRARPASLPQGTVVPTPVDWRPWNQALNMIESGHGEVQVSGHTNPG
jgi:hypothetical protein